MSLLFVFWVNNRVMAFFGNMKDELDLSSCANLGEVRAAIDEYIVEYNYHRYQWNLKKMTPVQYRSHLLSA